MPPMDKAVISIEKLSKDYPGTRAVCGIDLEILEGEFFGLLGPNGAGKTTTIALLTGLIEPSGGRILIDGISLSSDPLETKSRMGFVPQDFAFYPTLDAVENLRFFGRLYGLRGPRLSKRIQDVLDIAGLQEKTRQPVATFSNGMMRRLNLAIGLIHEPHILILDEPTVGVDAHMRNALYETLDRLNRQGVTVLYTTHQMEEAQRLCRRVAIMDQGRILTVDTPEALIRRFGEGLVRVEFKKAAGAELKKQMARMETVLDLDGRERHWFLKTREPEKTVRALMDLDGVREFGVSSLNILEPNLESVFLQLTGRRLRDSSDGERPFPEGKNP
jgi:ABC-2 type transport system ATP-binding protein